MTTMIASVINISIKVKPAPGWLRPKSGTLDRWITSQTLRNPGRVGNRKAPQMTLALSAPTLYLARQQMGA